jgi:hypothetical protein
MTSAVKVTVQLELAAPLVARVHGSGATTGIEPAGFDVTPRSTVP